MPKILKIPHLNKTGFATFGKSVLPNMNETKNPVILFDGVCNLCNASVQWVLRRDKKAIFRFASLQSPSGGAILKKLGLPTDKFDSIVLVDGEKHFTRSAAAIKIASKLGGFWQIFIVFRLLPSFLRDGLYDFIARNRYRWFGRRETCWLPSPELKSRFL